MPYFGNIFFTYNINIMKKNSVTAFHNKLLLAACMLSALSLFSCTPKTDGGGTVITESCADQKDYSAEYPSQINKINHFISLDEGLKFTQNFARNKKAILSGEFKGADSLLTDYETFNLAAIDSVLCQENTVAFRIYSAFDENKKMRFVIVGVDKDGNDILQKNGLKPNGLLNKQLPGSTAGATGAAAAAPEAILDNGQRKP